jgi:hypothetical protein
MLRHAVLDTRRRHQRSGASGHRMGEIVQAGCSTSMRISAVSVLYQCCRRPFVTLYQHQLVLMTGADELEPSAGHIPIIRRNREERDLRHAIPRNARRRRR